MIKFRNSLLTAVTAVSIAVISAFGCIGASAAEENSDNSSSSSSGDYTAVLVGSMGNLAQYNADSAKNNGSDIADVTGNGQYTVTFSASSADGAITSIDFLSLQIDNLTSDKFPSLGVAIDSVSVDGKELDYKTTPSNVNLNYYQSGNGCSKIYLTVTEGWGADETEDVPSNTKVTDNISVTFTVSGMDGAPENAAVATEAQTIAPQNTTTTAATQDETSGSVVTGNASLDNQTPARVENGKTGDAGLIILAVIMAGATAATVFTVSKKRN